MKIADGWTLTRLGVILGIIGVSYLSGYNSGMNRGWDLGAEDGKKYCPKSECAYEPKR